MTPFTRFAALSLLAALSASAGPPAELLVQAEYPHDPQGTTHFAQALTLSIGSARPLRLEDPYLPVPGPSFRLPDSRFVLLGWSSPGSGMQSIHALLIGAQEGAVRRLAQVTSFTDRSNAALLVRREADGSLTLGLPEPPTTFLHNEDEWSLVGTGRQPLKIAALRRLKYEAVTLRSDDLFYSPPARLAPRPASVTWIRITPSGFALARSGKE